MEKLRICFDFRLSLNVRTHKGKIQKKYIIMALGSTYSEALWAAYFDLKKRRKVLLQVNDAKVTGIAFAYDTAYQRVPNLLLKDHKPEIPLDLNAEVNSLPQKKDS